MTGDATGGGGLTDEREAATEEGGAGIRIRQGDLDAEGQGDGDQEEEPVSEGVHELDGKAFRTETLENPGSSRYRVYGL